MCFPLSVHGLTAGELIEQDARLRQQQDEREQALRSAQEITPDVRLQQTPEAASPHLPEQESPCFSIRQIQLLGAQADRFAWAPDAANSPDKAIDRCLGSEGVNLVMRRIQNAIVQRGYTTTRVVAAPQDLSTGILALTLVPGVVRAIRAAEGTDTRATFWNALPGNTGEILNLRDIEQGLENFKRLPSVQADIQIVPAEGDNAQPGESDLVVSWQQPMPFRFSFGLDDSGSKSTGKYQGSFTFSYDNWLGLNDLFYASVNHDVGGDAGGRGTSGYAFHYSLPWDYWLWSWTASSSEYFQTVAGANQNYIYSGDSKNAEIALTRLLHRDATSKTSLSGKGWMRAASNFIDDTEVNVQRRRTAGWEAKLSHRHFLGQSTVDMDVTYRRGTGAWDAMPAPEEAFGEGTSRMALWSASAQWAIPLAENGLRYTGNWRAQWNRTPLVAQDRFSIGGRYTVRGFDGETTLMSERGWLVRNELVLPVATLFGEAYLGLDYGHVGGASSAFLLGDHLAGAVLGVRGQIKGLNYDLFAGTPIDKPDGFRAPDFTSGFNLNLSF